MEENNLNELTGREILHKLFPKELNSKKNILEAIEKIKFLIKDKEKIKELGENSYLLLKKEFDIQGMIKKYKTLYKQLGEK